MSSSAIPSRRSSGQDGAVTGGHPFVDGLLGGQMRLIHGRDQAMVFQLRRRDQVHVGFDARGDHAARIAVAGVVVDDEILQAGLQHHAIFVKLHSRGVLDHPRHIAMLDLPPATHFVAARLLAPRTVGPPMPATAVSTVA